MNSFVKMCWDIIGFRIEDHIEDWYLDGNQALWTVFSGMFPLARGHMCLEHAKKLSSSRFSDGYRKLVPSLQEFIAFLPKNVRHVAAVNLLD